MTIKNLSPINVRRGVEVEARGTDGECSTDADDDMELSEHGDLENVRPADLGHVRESRQRSASEGNWDE